MKTKVRRALRRDEVEAMSKIKELKDPDHGDDKLLCFP